MSPPSPSRSSAGTRAPEKIEDLLDGLREKYTVLIVTHNMAQARRASDECIFMLLGELIEHGSTGWIAPGWHARVVAEGRLLLSRSTTEGPAARGDPAAADPMRLEVFNGLFMHVAEQMGVVLQQTASSVNIKERLDFSCAIFDAQANLVANAPHMPVHLGSMGASVAAVLDAHVASLRPGDSCLVNSPYHGGTHLPDMTVVTPVFDAPGERVIFFTASRAQHADIGGITPGSMPPGSRGIHEEGALFTPVTIVCDGRLDEALLLEALAAGPA